MAQQWTVLKCKDNTNKPTEICGLGVRWEDPVDSDFEPIEFQHNRVEIKTPAERQKFYDAAIAERNKELARRDPASNMSAQEQSMLGELITKDGG